VIGNGRAEQMFADASSGFPVQSFDNTIEKFKELHYEISERVSNEG
jgi:hypothetical protein